MAVKKNLLEMTDVKLLVDSFYLKVREDQLLSPVFSERIGNNWDMHLDKMYRFWQTVLLGEHTYYGSPFAPHGKMPLEKKHFDQWIRLFNETVDEYFKGEKADEAKWRAGKMAEMFLMKIDFIKGGSLV